MLPTNPNRVISNKITFSGQSYQIYGYCASYPLTKVIKKQFTALIRCTLLNTYLSTYIIRLVFIVLKETYIFHTYFSHLNPFVSNFLRENVSSIHASMQFYGRTCYDN